jgi:DNA-binding NarL/FixJ family response regulator
MSKSSSPSAKIIIADDHPIFRGGLHAVLKKLPFVSKVSEAADGREVIALLSKEHYDIVLMDVQMEPMNGIEATKIVREKHPKTNVIALSMSVDERYIFEMIEKGASGYLIKNADKEEIEQALIETLAGRQYFSSAVSKVLLEHYSRTKESSEDKEADTLSKERIRELIFLICNEYTSQEIGEILYLSVRTIEKYRARVLKITDSKNLMGLLKFAMENKILDDSDLKKKFAKALAKKKAGKK